MKNDLHNIIRSAAILKAIGHPIRVQIIIALSKKRSMTVTDLSEELRIDQPVMSLHLAILRKKNIIKAIKKGKKSEYSISNTSIQQVINIAYYSKN